MLERLLVQNLGCFDESMQPVELSQETVLIGPNNSGKSTFIAGLNLLRWAVQHRNVNFSNSLFNFHNWMEAVHDHQTARKIKVSAVLDTIGLDLETQGGRITRQGSSTGNLWENKNKELMKKIWYLRPHRSLIPYNLGIGTGRDPVQSQLSPNGHDVIQFLLERYTEIDPNWKTAEAWFRKIDPEISSIRTPIRGNVTFFENLLSRLEFNASLHGSGFHSVAPIIAATIFSAKGSIIIVEEPEICLHKKSQEAIVDMFNYVVNEQEKQVIFTTHSWDMLLPFISDVGRGARRGKQHPKTDPTKFKLLAFKKSEGKVGIEQIDLENMKVYDVKKYLKKLWG